MKIALNGRRVAYVHVLQTMLTGPVIGARIQTALAPELFPATARCQWDFDSFHAVNTSTISLRRNDFALLDQ